MLSLEVQDPLLREIVRRRPLIFAAQVFFMMIGLYAFITVVSDVMFGEESVGAVFDLTRPAVVGSVVLTWLLWRGSRGKPDERDAA